MKFSAFVISSVCTLIASIHAMDTNNAPSGSSVEQLNKRWWGSKVEQADITDLLICQPVYTGATRYTYFCASKDYPMMEVGTGNHPIHDIEHQLPTGNEILQTGDELLQVAGKSKVVVSFNLALAKTQAIRVSLMRKGSWGSDTVVKSYDPIQREQHERIDGETDQDFTARQNQVATEFLGMELELPEHVIGGKHYLKFEQFERYNARGKLLKQSAKTDVMFTVLNPHTHAISQGMARRMATLQEKINRMNEEMAAMVFAVYEGTVNFFKEIGESLVYVGRLSRNVLFGMCGAVGLAFGYAGYAVKKTAEYSWDATKQTAHFAGVGLKGAYDGTKFVGEQCVKGAKYTLSATTSVLATITGWNLLTSKIAAMSERSFQKTNDATLNNNQRNLRPTRRYEAAPENAGASAAPVDENFDPAVPAEDAPRTARRGGASETKSHEA